MKNLKKLACALVLSGLVGAVQAVGISLSPLSKPVTVGNDVSFDVYVNFNSTIGGLFGLTYDDSKLGIPSSGNFFDYDSSFLSSNTTLSMYAPSLTTAGLIEGFGFSGSFSGNALLGTITFTSTGTGVATISAIADADDSFYDGSSLLLPSDYGSANANVSAVPVPAAVWLMASGLLGMVGLSRRT